MGRREMKPQAPLLGKSLYDTLKTVVLVVLPALGAAYYSLDAVWNLPKEDEVVGTIAIVATFLGVFLKYDNARYNSADANQFDGVLVVNETNPAKDNFKLDFVTPPEVVKDQTVMKLQVQRES